MATEYLYHKSEVGFEHPAQGPDHCRECTHFTPQTRAEESSCDIVIGKVEGGDWCEKFKQR